MHCCGGASYAKTGWCAPTMYGPGSNGRNGVNRYCENGMKVPSVHHGMTYVRLGGYTSPINVRWNALLIE